MDSLKLVPILMYHHEIRPCGLGSPEVCEIWWKNIKIEIKLTFFILH
jgi:hypothetical protein